MELVPTRARTLLPLLCYCILPLNYIYSTLKAYLEDKENENTMKYLKLEAEHRLKTNRIFKKEGFIAENVTNASFGKKQNLNRVIFCLEMIFSQDG